MVSCKSCGCSKTKDAKMNKITFHRFPTAENIRREWIMFIGGVSILPKFSYLCSQHFEEKCFYITNKGKTVKLIPDAIPTIYTFKDVEQVEKLDVPSTSQSNYSTQPSVPNVNMFVQQTPPKARKALWAFNKDDTPRKIGLKRTVQRLSKKVQCSNKRIRILQKKVNYQKRKITHLKGLLKNLTDNNLLNSESAHSIMTNFGDNEDFIKRLFSKQTGQKIKKAYSPLERSFALTLHYFSPKAYSYVRQKFFNALPHSKTLSYWYAAVDGAPGFTKEALNMLKLKAQQSEEKIICSVMFDEMSIRKHVEYDGTNYHGFVDFGNHMNSDSMDLAREVLVFMVVAINQSWKIPVGYFLINGCKAYIC